MYRLSCDPKDKPWLPVMKCPLCGYESTVTNICRGCPETEPNEVTTVPQYCNKHKTYHKNKNGEYTSHQGVNMEYSGYVEEWGNNKRRKFTPTPDELSRIWIGYGVVYESPQIVEKNK
jgi:hypothetical protein